MRMRSQFLSKPGIGPGPNGVANSVEANTIEVNTPLNQRSLTYIISNPCLAAHTFQSVRNILLIPLTTFLLRYSNDSC